MAVSSMTGLARAAGSSGTWRWTFELKTVNAKGLDIRLRMPSPFDRAEGEARARLAKARRAGPASPRCPRSVRARRLRRASISRR